jgi:AraC-like DNA-binding protein
MATLRRRIQSTLKAAGECSYPDRRTRIEVVIRHLEEFLNDSPEVQLTLGHVAELACMEKTYCCRLYRNIVGRTFRNWIRELRIGKAGG